MRILFFFGNAWRGAFYAICYADLGVIYVNISRTDRPPVLKSEVFRLDWNHKNTPPQVNRGQRRLTQQYGHGSHRIERLRIVESCGTEYAFLRSFIRASGSASVDYSIGVKLLLAPSAIASSTDPPNLAISSCATLVNQTLIQHGSIESSKNFPDRWHHSKPKKRGTECRPRRYRLFFFSTE